MIFFGGRGSGTPTPTQDPHVCASSSEPWLFTNAISKVHVPKSLARDCPYNHRFSFISAKSVNPEYMGILKLSFRKFVKLHVINLKGHASIIKNKPF